MGLSGIMAALGGGEQKERRPLHLSALMEDRARFVRARFDAAQTTEDNARHWSMVDAASADAEASHETRCTLRLRSRYEVLNNSYAKGVVQMLANDTIGTGPRLQFLSEDDDFNDRVEADFAKWAEEARLDETLRLMRMARCQDGESFAVMGTNPRMFNAVKLKLDVIEADRIEGETLMGEDGSEGVDGITYDRWGNPVSYRMLKYHPGDDSFQMLNDHIEVPAKFMLHAFVKYRPGLHRGVPELTAALPLFAQLRRYNLATLSAAEAAADFAAILYTDSPADGESADVEPLDKVRLERNMMLTMPAGWKMGQLESKHPTSNHADFVKCILAEIARCICSTYGTVAGNFSGFNYASGRLDNQVYQKSLLVDRRKWEQDVLNPLLRMWLREWSLAADVPLPNDMAHEWFWDGFPHVDPTKEANAQQTRLANMTTTLADEYAKEGKDYMKKLRQRAKEMRLMRELGLVQEIPANDGGKNEEEEEGEKE